MERSKLDRINELARLAKERELTQEELNERERPCCLLPNRRAE